MLPTSGNETSTTVAGIQVSASIAQVTASDSVCCRVEPGQY